MFVRWARALVLVVVVALFANAECYGSCAIAPCSSTQIPASGCHHHQPSPDDQARCAHQHFELTAPESGVAKVSFVKAAPVVPVVTPASITILTEPVSLSLLHAGSPPHPHASHAPSVLRI